MTKFQKNTTHENGTYITTGAVEDEHLIKNFLSKTYFNNSMDFLYNAITIHHADFTKTLEVIATKK